MIDNRRKPKQRLKPQELVRSVMFILSEELERMDPAQPPRAEGVHASTIRHQLHERFGLEYRSDRWLFTQLHRYEQDIGSRLFARGQDPDTGEQLLRLHDSMENFVQKQHLHVSQKIKTANGIYDFITKTAGRGPGGRPIRLFLGAGTTTYHLFALFLERSVNETLALEIYTHNAGCATLLDSRLLSQQSVKVVVMGGPLDPITMTFLGLDEATIRGIRLDYVVQGTSSICDGKLYIESERERKIKELILKQSSGTKLLALTKHEFAAAPPQDAEAYGALTDYDYLVMPRSFPKSLTKEHESNYLDYSGLFETEIRNWYYEILKINRS